MRITFNLGVFSLYRTELMGVATLLIIVCHMPLFGVIMPNCMSTILGAGGFGVDIFLFLSGIGMYNSYSSVREHKQTVLHWLLKRYMRIVCPLILLVLSFTILNSSQENLQWGIVVLKLSGFGPLFGNGALWFIPCILLLYLVTPFVNSLFCSKWRWYWLAVFSLLCYVYAYLPPNSSIFHFILNRWPIYFFGYSLSSQVKEKKNGSALLYILLPVIVYTLFYVLNHTLGYHFCLFGLQGIASVSIFALLINKLKSRKLNVTLGFVGAISLESYITNEYLMRYLQRFSWSIGNIDISFGNWTFYLVGTCLCIILSVYVNKLSRKIFDLLKLS